jgi:uncharacterized peroxidase-related enzyme
LPWIRVIRENEAKGELNRDYEAVSSARGKAANIMRIHSLHPETMQTHLDLYRSLLYGHSPLPRRTRELIATVVSSLNSCDYCVAHHSSALEFYWKDPELVRRVAEDYHTVELSGKERAILEYAEKLTLTPSEMKEGDVERLRKAGLNDEEILDVALIVSYFGFVNRVALGLGVTFDENEVSGYQY